MSVLPAYLLYLEGPSSLEVRLFTRNLGIYHYTGSPHDGDDVRLAQSYADGDVGLVIYREALASQVSTNVGEDKIMASNSQGHAVGFGQYRPRVSSCWF